MTKKLFKLFKLLCSEIMRVVAHSIIFFPECIVGHWLRVTYYKGLLNGRLGDNPHFSYGVEIHDDKKITIGHNFNVGPYVTITPGGCFGILIGDDVGIGHGTYIRSSNHTYFALDKPIEQQGHMCRKVLSADGKEASLIIEDNVYIGAYCKILSGAKIGRGSVLAAGSVVSSEIPEDSIVAGNPARVVGNRKNKMFAKGYYYLNE